MAASEHPARPKPAFVYMVRCTGGQLYTGWTNAPAARLQAHKSGRGARYTRAMGAEGFAYLERCGSRPDALRREAALKKLWGPIEELTQAQRMEEFMFLGLRMLRGVTRTEFKETFGVEIEAVYGEVLNQLQEEDLIEKKAGVIKLSDHGMDISNYVLAQFLLD